MFNGAKTTELIQTALKAGKIVMVNRYQYEGAELAEMFFTDSAGHACVKRGKSSVSLAFANIAVYVRK